MADLNEVHELRKLDDLFYGGLIVKEELDRRKQEYFDQKKCVSIDNIAHNSTDMIINYWN
jgi:hypothetical protein